MSYALQAIVLLCLDQRLGEWVPIQCIAERTGLSVYRTLQVCDDLVERGQIQLATRQGVPHYGVRCEGSQPAFSTGAECATTGGVQ